MVLLALGGERKGVGERKGRGCDQHSGVISMVLDINVHWADLINYSWTLLGTSYLRVFLIFFQILIHMKKTNVVSRCWGFQWTSHHLWASLIWPVALGLHKIYLLTHLCLGINWFSCGTTSESDKELFLGETKLEDSHSKTLPAALHQSKTAQGEYEIAPAKHKGIAWHQIFCVTCVLQVYCRIYPGSRCLWLVEWYQNQD